MYALRSFLPDGREVFGAGHNILGVWWYLAEAGLLDFTNPIVNESGIEEFTFQQELGGQLLPVAITRQKSGFKVSIRRSPPKYHGFHPDIAALASSIGLQASDIGDGKLEPQVLSTSTTHHLFVPITSVDALNRTSFDRSEILAQIQQVHKDAFGLYLFTPIGNEEGAKSYQARFFSPGMSGEDPATGSAAGPLSAYLLEHREIELKSGKAMIKVLQGLRVGRKCVIDVEIQKGEDGQLQVNFEGTGVVVSKGDILRPSLDLEF